MSAAGRAIRVAVIAACCGSAGRAAASPGTDPTVGRAVFTGATLPVASSIVLDPAALALGTSELSFYVGFTGTLDQISIDRKLVDLDTGALSAGPRIRTTVISPGIDGAVLWRPTEKLAFGAQVRTPPEQKFIEGENDLRYFTLGGYQRELQTSLALSVKATNELLFGASITVDWTFMRLRFARDTALAAGHGAGGVGSDCGGSPCGVENPLASERYDLYARQRNPLGDGYVVNLGVMYELARDVWLAASYHTPPGGASSTTNTLDGDTTVVQAPRAGGQVLHGGGTVYLSEPVTVDAELRARLPHNLDVHVGGRWEDLSRNLGYDVRSYGSTFPRANIPEWIEQQRDFKDVLALWAGVEQVEHGETWHFGGRVGFETAAVPDRSTTPNTISPTSATLDLGAQLRLGSVVLQLSYGLQYFPPVSVTKSTFDPRDRVTCVDGGFDYTTAACAAVRDGFALPTAAGDYARIEHAVRLGLRYDWN